MAIKNTSYIVDNLTKLCFRLISAGALGHFLKLPAGKPQYQSEVDEGNDAVNLKSPLESSLDVMETSSIVTAMDNVGNILKLMRIATSSGLTPLILPINLAKAILKKWKKSKWLLYVILLTLMTLQWLTLSKTMVT
jgi:hypothetical protein